MQGRELLLAYIEDEDKALIQNRQGKLYPSMHYQIKKELKKLFKLLTPQESRRFCYHYLRLGSFIRPQSEADLEIIKAAYLETFEWREKGYDKPYYDLFVAIMVFGFSDQKQIDGPQDVESYNKYLKVLGQVSAYTSLRTMIKKIDRFEPYADDETALRILQCMQAVDYYHKPFDGRYEQYYKVYDLEFWGMVIILLLNPKTRETLCKEMNALPDDFPRRSDHLEVLNEFKASVDKYLKSK